MCIANAINAIDHNKLPLIITNKFEIINKHEALGWHGLHSYNYHFYGPDT